MKRFAVLVALSAIVGLTSVACQETKYSAEAIAGAKSLLHLGSDSAAIKFLDDLANGGAAEITLDSTQLVDRASVRWSGLVDGITTRIGASVAHTPDDQEVLRSIVVGSACDAFDQQVLDQRALTSNDVSGIVNEHVRTSRLPSLFGNVSLVAGLTSEVENALRQNDLASAFPGLGTKLMCAKAGG